MKHYENLLVGMDPLIRAYHQEDGSNAKRPLSALMICIVNGGGVMDP